MDRPGSEGLVAADLRREHKSRPVCYHQKFLGLPQFFMAWRGGVGRAQLPKRPNSLVQASLAGETRPDVAEKNP